MDVRMQKAFDYAIEGTKQLLALNTAVLALTITVARDVSVGNGNLLLAAWVSFLVSVLCGIWTLFALMTELTPRERNPDAQPSVAATRVRAPSLLQIGAFALGIACLVFFGVSGVN
jgi:fatty acid desaturase